MQAKKTNRERRRRKATTQEVIGDVKGHGQIDPKWARHYHNLMDVRTHLRSQKEELVKDELAEQPTFSQHMADAATDSFDRDLALSLISSEQDALYEIEQALNRIKQGTYGICELTGKPIARQRLNAIPWTRFSAQAERQLENEGAVGRPRLAPREAVPRMDISNQVAEET